MNVTYTRAQLEEILQAHRQESEQSLIEEIAKFEEYQSKQLLIKEQEERLQLRDKMSKISRETFAREKKAVEEVLKNRLTSGIFDDQAWLTQDKYLERLQ